MLARRFRARICHTNTAPTAHATNSRKTSDAITVGSYCTIPKRLFARVMRTKYASRFRNSEGRRLEK